MMLGHYNIARRDRASKAFRLFGRSLGFIILLQLCAVAGAPAAWAQATPEIPWNKSLSLDKVPVHSTFDQLVEEHNLSSAYDPVTNTATITSIAAETDGGKSGTFVPLDQVTYDELTQAMASFGIAARGLRYDPGTRTVAILGDAQHVQEIADLIKTLETAHLKQRDRLGAERTRELQLKRAELAQQAYDELLGPRSWSHAPGRPSRRSSGGGSG